MSVCKYFGESHHKTFLLTNKTRIFIAYREVTIGPTALLALMTSRHTNLGGMSGPHLAILLCFLSGIVEFIMALLRLGALVDLISLPVTIGFTSATALIIGASQLKVKLNKLCSLLLVVY